MCQILRGGYNDIIVAQEVDLSDVPLMDSNFPLDS